MMRILVSIVLVLVASAGAIAAEPATKPAEAGNPVGKLADGTTVEILGLRVNNQKPWWRADGSALPSGPYDADISTPSGRIVEIALRSPGIGAVKTRWIATGTDVGFKRGPGVDAILLCNFPAEQERANVKITFLKGTAVALALRPDADPAKRAAQTISKDVPALGKVTLANPREVDGKAVITATIPKPPASLLVLVRGIPFHPKRLLAIDPRSALHGTDGRPRDIAYDSPLSDVSEFQIEMRDYSNFIEFRDVSVKPGVKTDVKVVTSESPQDKADEQPSEQPINRSL